MQKFFLSLFPVLLCSCVVVAVPTAQGQGISSTESNTTDPLSATFDSLLRKRIEWFEDQYHDIKVLKVQGTTQSPGSTSTASYSDIQLIVWLQSQQVALETHSVDGQSWDDPIHASPEYLHIYRQWDFHERVIGLRLAFDYLQRDKIYGRWTSVVLARPRLVLKGLRDQLEYMFADPSASPPTTYYVGMDGEVYTSIRSATTTSAWLPQEFQDRDCC